MVLHASSSLGLVKITHPELGDVLQEEERLGEMSRAEHSE